jgi:hypothetical protein
MTGIREPFHWLWARTYRLAQLLWHDHILEGVQDVVNGLDRYCELNDIDPKRITLGDAIFVKGLDYVEYPLIIEGR